MPAPRAGPRQDALLDRPGGCDRQGASLSHRDIGFHHYAFELRNRKDVDGLQAFLHQEGVTIVDPADEYYDDYYVVFFLDPDGLKLEGMKYGELKAKAARKRAAAKKTEAAKKTSVKKGAKKSAAAKTARGRRARFF
ncbi:MAG: VOC family protein [Methyloceanibacter sp.]|uniref:VOC family protein n=1 Tax=Methyloceanibacter sp. TaxID=1965321 RepID=UPI003D9AE4E5